MDRERLVSRDAHLVFTMKDHHTLVESELLGEAVLPLSRLQNVPFSQAGQVEQQLLSLTPVRMRGGRQRGGGSSVGCDGALRVNSGGAFLRS